MYVVRIQRNFNAFSCDPDSQQCEFRARYLTISIRTSLLIAYQVPNTIMGSEGEREKNNKCDSGPPPWLSCDL